MAYSIAKERELLERDRDIRNLIGTRNLYIAVISTSARAATQCCPGPRCSNPLITAILSWKY
jgi:hypothetical protein